MRLRPGGDGGRRPALLLPGPPSFGSGDVPAPPPARPPALGSRHLALRASLAPPGLLPLGSGLSVPCSPCCSLPSAKPLSRSVSPLCLWDQASATPPDRRAADQAPPLRHRAACPSRPSPISRFLLCRLSSRLLVVQLRVLLALCPLPAFKCVCSPRPCCPCFIPSHCSRGS